MRNKKLIPFEVIKKAVAGEPENGQRRNLERQCVVNRKR